MSDSAIGEGVEIVRDGFARGGYRAALFDFDGTLSYLRCNWPQVMIPMMVDVLAETPTDETREDLHSVVEDFVMRLNGKQTIYQMLQLVEEVKKRGGKPDEALEYKHRYHDLLLEDMGDRVARLQSGETAPEEWAAPHARQMLQALQDRGVELYLASGTDLQYVRTELAALKLDEFFGEHVYGALDDYQDFSKAMIIRRIIDDAGVPPAALVGFGDGYVEIEEVAKVGGAAVGVASDEHQRRGVNDWKRKRLINAGAHLIVPDYRCREQLLNVLGL